MTIVNIYFQGRPGDKRDTMCHAIIERHAGKVISSGTFLAAMERDVQAELPEDRKRSCIEALRNKGFEVEYEIVEHPPFPRVVP